LIAKKPTYIVDRWKFSLLKLKYFVKSAVNLYGEYKMTWKYMFVYLFYIFFLLNVFAFNLFQSIFYLIWNNMKVYVLENGVALLNELLGVDIEFAYDECKWFQGCSHLI